MTDCKVGGGGGGGGHTKGTEFSSQLRPNALNLRYTKITNGNTKMAKSRRVITIKNLKSYQNGGL